MKLLKVLIHIAIALAFTKNAFCENGNKIHIKALQCKVSDIIFSNLTCFAKSYSRTFSALNLLAYSRMPLHNVTVIYFVIF